MSIPVYLLKLNAKFLKTLIELCSLSPGAMDGLVNVWQLNAHELQSTMEGHSGTVTCIAISPNGLFVVSGSEDKTAKVWGLTIGVVVCSYVVGA